MTLDRDPATGRLTGAPRFGPRPLLGGPGILSFQVTSGLVTQLLATALIALMTMQVFGPISNVAQIAIVLLMATIHWRTLAGDVAKASVFLIYPVIAVASTYWSGAADVTLRYGIQFLFTALAGVILAATLGPRRFLVALYVGNLIVAVGSLFSGRYGMSMEGPVMIGLTGSKNQIAFVSQFTLASAVAVFLDGGQPRLLRLSTFGAAAVALALLAQANSATGILTAIGATVAFLGLLALRGFRVQARVGIILAAIVLVMPAVAFKDAIVEQAQRISTTVFKKDATLSGRTYLWAQADHLIEQRPAVGHGYRSVWLGKSVTTTGLLRWAGLPDGRGFNFHNTFREVAVDTGVLGLVAFVGSMGLAGVMLLLRFVRDGSLTSAFFFSTYLTYVARAFTELIIGPFQAGALILFALAGYCVLWRRSEPSDQD